MSRIVLIPAYCPDSKLVQLVHELRADGLRVVVVNGGSPSSYDDIFQQLDATLLSYTPNKGKGAALKTGLSYIQNHFMGQYVIATADADGQHTVQDIEHVLQTARENPGALVLGTRNFHSSCVPWRSRFGNDLTAGLFRLSTGIRCPDTQTGLRAFDDSLLSTMLKIEGNRYDYEMNVLLSLAEEQVSFIQVPISTIYSDGNKSSHFHVIRDSFLIYRKLLKFAFGSFSSFLIDCGLFNLFMIALTPAQANVLARMFSAFYNYSFNQKVVFQKSKHSLLKYIMLAMGILACDTMLIYAWISIDVPPYIAKILTEMILFFVSYEAQKHFVFRKEVKKDAQLLQKEL